MRRATTAAAQSHQRVQISIHALREEGDKSRLCSLEGAGISIHALREEGDKSRLCSLEGAGISIHALREEGDADQEAMKLLQTKFLSTPSARRATEADRFVVEDELFLSTPSARRATVYRCPSGR